mmetsp:Transcript_11036/g.22414  ORF Transcript_11036/g.22414 Transcript_11036/m.22414 type:complete len:333 (-) Transcript_11036:543-1541(-)
MDCLNHDTDEHVDDEKGSYQDEHQKNGTKDGALSPDVVPDLWNVLEEDTMQQQGVHRVQDAAEVFSVDACPFREAREGDPEDVDDDREHGQGDRYGSDGGEEALHHDHELRDDDEDAGHPRHPRDAQQTHKPQGGGIRIEEGVGVGHAIARCNDDCGHPCNDPGLHDGDEHEGRVEHEPNVSQRVFCLPKGHEAHEPLDCEEQAEEILHHNEDWVSACQDLVLVPICVYSDPHSIQADDDKGELLEPLTPGHRLPSALILVEVGDVVDRLGYGLPNLRLHLVGICEHCRRIHREEGEAAEERRRAVGAGRALLALWQAFVRSCVHAFAVAVP